MPDKPAAVLFDLDNNGVPRKGLAQAGKPGCVYILDRTNGEPLVGIEERQVPQEPRQATAATQPYPVGDAFVTQTLDIPPEGYQFINDGAIRLKTRYIIATLSNGNVSLLLNMASRSALGHYLVCRAGQALQARPGGLPDGC